VPSGCDMTALFQVFTSRYFARAIGSCTLEKIHSTHSWYYPPNTCSLALPRHPGSGLNRHGLITFPGVRHYPLASHASGQLGPVNRPFAPSLSVGFHTSIWRVTTLESPMFWVGLSISILLFPICVTIGEGFDLPFHHLFPTPLSLPH
jgi:hypothetical protein